MKKLLFVLLLLVTLPISAVAQTDILGVRLWPAPERTRLVFDLSGPIEHSLFTLKGPDRIVIDLRNAYMDRKLAQLSTKDSPLSGLRSAPRNKKDLRIVLDAAQALRPKSFYLKPFGEHGHRLVLDLYHANKKGVETKTTKAPKKAKSIKKKPKPTKIRDVIIAIDAGHGGEDPGAKGHKGTREKDVVLKIAKELEKLVKKAPGMRPVMTRNGDYYVSLRGRIKRARAQRADIFISIHADAFRNAKAHGSSVYTLSARGASSEAARWLAESENNADLIGGVSLDDKDDVLASVLLDLSQTASLEASLDVGNNILSGLRRIGRVHKPRVQSASFQVLKAPDIPSVLVETAFISNPEEERKLRTRSYQKRLAGAVMNGIRSYFKRFPPPNTRFALLNDVQHHVIKNGDTLSTIASTYQVSVQNLRSANELRNDTIRVGQTLKIPVDS